jgi:hypothetical protein
MTCLKFHGVPIIFALVVVSQVERVEQIIAILAKFPLGPLGMQLGLKNHGNFQNAISPEPLELFHRTKKQIKGHSISYRTECSDMAGQAIKMAKMVLA